METTNKTTWTMQTVLLNAAGDVIKANKPRPFSSARGAEMSARDVYVLAWRGMPYEARAMDPSGKVIAAYAPPGSTLRSRGWL